jgi:hypothetical protein
MRFFGRAPWMAIPFLLALTACWDRLAGNGSEVENAVAGTVRTPDGKGAAGVTVSLIPEGYDPLSDSNRAAPARGTTDASGRYGFSADTGTYNVFARQSGTGRAFLIPHVRITGSGHWDLGADTLKPPGHIHVTLPAGSWQGAHVYLPGTPVAETIDAAADSSRNLVLDSVPEGSFAVVIVRNDDPARVVVGEEVPVLPDRTSSLPYAQWKRSARLHLDAAALGGGLASDLAAAPLLLRLDGANFDFSAAGKGADLRFTSDAGSPLPHQVQSWDSAGMSALVWVRIDTVYGGNRTTRLRMYWGNPSVTSAAEAVFDPADGYVGAWHLDDAPKGVPPGFPDAGASGDSVFAQGALAAADTLPAADTVAAVTRADGVAGRGAHLNGKDAYLISAKTYAGPPAYAYSFWLKTSTRQGGKILGWVAPGIRGAISGRPGNFNFDRVVWMDDDGFIRFGFTIASLDTNSVGSWQAFVSAKHYNDGQWHHVACSVSETQALLSIDGEKVVDYSGTMRALPDNGYWRMGYLGDGMWDPMWTSEYFQGSLDEIQIIHRSRGEDWAKLEYASQKPGSRLILFDTP